MQRVRTQAVTRPASSMQSIANGKMTLTEESLAASNQRNAEKQSKLKLKFQVSDDSSELNSDEEDNSAKRFDQDHQRSSIGQGSGSLLLETHPDATKHLNELSSSFA